jgi:hypothetical protein
VAWQTIREDADFDASQALKFDFLYLNYFGGGGGVPPTKKKLTVLILEQVTLTHNSVSGQKCKTG